MPIRPHMSLRGPGQTEVWGDAPPDSGSWKVGDLCWNESTTGGPLGWICIAAGSPGTWVPLNIVPYSATVFPWGPGNKVGFAASAPSSGTWSRGDVVWNTQPSASGPPGWVCVSSGTPGTWKAMANLAA